MERPAHKIIPMDFTESNDTKGSVAQGVDDVVVHCKDCQVWRRSSISIKVEQSELRFCNRENKLKFGFDYHCLMKLEND